MEIKRAIEILKLRKKFIADINLETLMAYDMAIKALEEKLEEEFVLGDRVEIIRGVCDLLYNTIGITGTIVAEDIEAQEYIIELDEIYNNYGWRNWENNDDKKYLYANKNKIRLIKSGE